MEMIKLSRREPSREGTQKMEETEQRVALEVFEELKYQLESMGYLPDEYFLMDREWENGREIPKDADIFCTTDYGGSEGIYLDVYLKWYENGQPVIQSFITGKTLGESGADLDRMFLISSAITKAFHGEGGAYSRYLRTGEQPEPESMILHLSPSEQRIFINALVEQRERMVEQTNGVEQLLRRMTGSITAYMNEAGQRPLRLSDYDRAVLAIQDGEFEAFSSLYPRVPDRADDLLIEVSGRPGRVGGNMVLMLLAAVERFSPEAYLTACKRAVDTGDSQRVRTLVAEAKSHLSEPSPSLAGEVMSYAYANDRQNITRALIGQCTAEQIAAAPPALLRMAAASLDLRTATALVDKGIQPGELAADILHTLTAQRQGWMAEQLLEHGMPVAPDDYSALHTCINNKATDIAKLLLDKGIDLDQYQAWVEHYPKSEGYEEVMAELNRCWAERQSEPEQAIHPQNAPEEPSFSGFTMSM